MGGGRVRDVWSSFMRERPTTGPPPGRYGIRTTTIAEMRAEEDRAEGRCARLTPICAKTISHGRKKDKASGPNEKQTLRI